MRSLLVQIMTLALTIWEKQLARSKIELAEQSGLWRLQLDKDTYRTRTLDKYLNLATLPANPRWNNVTKTAHFVLKQQDCQDTLQTKRLIRTLIQFESLLVSDVRHGGERATA